MFVLKVRIMGKLKRTLFSLSVKTYDNIQPFDSTTLNMWVIYTNNTIFSNPIHDSSNLKENKLALLYEKPTLESFW